MSELNNLLEDDTLDFVLQNRDESNSTSSEELTATIRGDLARVKLPDIFQTLSMSQMEGTLRVSAGFDQTYVHFADGKIRVLPPLDLQTRRLGYRLLASGLMEAKEIRTAFIKQKREGGKLGEILEAEGLVDKVQFDAIQLALEEDFLLELFTLQRGAFSFFKESFPASGIEERLHGCVAFEADQVLLEIARRSDEWEIILASLGDLDEVFVRTGENVPERVGEIQDDLYEHIEGKKSLRDIAGGMLDSLFDVAKAAQKLFDGGAIAHAPTYHLITLARTAIAAQHQRVALSFLALIQTNREPSLEELEESAELLVLAGDSKSGAELLAETARSVSDYERRLEILRRAKQLDTLNRNVLEQLVFALAADPDLRYSDDYYDSATLLSEIFTDANEFDEALTLIEELEIDRPQSLSIATRKAKVLFKMERAEEASETLASLAAFFRETKDSSRLTRTLEQILKLDPRNQRARSELKALRESKGVKRLKKVAAGLIGVLILQLSWSYVSGYLAEASARKQLKEASQLLYTGKLDESQAIVRGVTERFPGSEIAVDAFDLLNRITARRSAEKRLREKRELAQLQGGLAASVSMLDDSRLWQAFRSYSELLGKHGKFTKEIERSFAARFRALAAAMQEDTESLQTDPPPPVAQAQSPAARADLFARLAKVFPKERTEGLIEFARKQKAFAKPSATDKRLAKLLPKGFVASIPKYAERAKRIQADRNRLRQLIATDEKTAKLNTPFLLAQKAEAAYDFAEAFKQYSRLASGFKKNPETAAVFAQKRDYCGSILQELARLRTATEHGDYASAAKRFVVLKDMDPSVPFETFVELPLRIESGPPGATIRNNGKVVGKTPMLLRYKPRETLSLTIEAEGFSTVKIPPEAATAGRFRTVLEMHPLFERKLGGALTGAAQYEADENRMLLSDRSGTAWCFDLTKLTEVWRRRFQDLSGDIGTPFPLGETVLLPARDGRLRALDIRTGTPLWEARLETGLLSPMVRSGSNAWIATERGKLHQVSITDGSVLTTRSAGGRMRFGPTVDRRGVVYLNDRAGSVTAIDREGGALWNRTIADSGWVPPKIAHDLLLVASDDKRLYALDITDGSVRWKTDVADALRHAPATDATRAWVVTLRKQLLEIDLKSGAVTRRTTLPARPSGPPSCIDGILFVPLGKRGVLLMHTEDLSRYCHMSVGLATELAVRPIADRFLVFESARGVLRLFDRKLLNQR